MCDERRGVPRGYTLFKYCPDIRGLNMKRVFSPPYRFRILSLYIDPIHKNRILICQALNAVVCIKSSGFAIGKDFRIFTASVFRLVSGLSLKIKRRELKN